MILHDIVWPDEEVQDMSNMCCLLCWDIVEANPGVTNLLTLQQLHKKKYTLWLASLAYNPEQVANQLDSNDNSKKSVLLLSDNNNDNNSDKLFKIGGVQALYRAPCISSCESIVIQICGSIILSIDRQKQKNA